MQEYPTESEKSLAAKPSTLPGNSRPSRARIVLDQINRLGELASGIRGQSYTIRDRLIGVVATENKADDSKSPPLPNDVFSRYECLVGEISSMLRTVHQNLSNVIKETETE